MSLIALSFPSEGLDLQGFKGQRFCHRKNLLCSKAQMHCVMV